MVTMTFISVIIIVSMVGIFLKDEILLNFVDHYQQNLLFSTFHNLGSYKKLSMLTVCDNLL